MKTKTRRKKNPKPKIMSREEKKQLVATGEEANQLNW